MHNRYLSWLFLGAAFALIALRAQTPGTPITGGAERVLAARVTGAVQMTVGGQTSPVKTDDRVPTAAKIVTGKDASIVLVFSNGATTQLGSDTELVIVEFLQDPFASTVRMADLAEEPSRSRTRLALNRGELVGNVKKLKHAEGSTYTVVTPVGAAGIRGTTFRIVFRPVAVGQAFGAIPQQAEFSLTTLEGEVSFQQGPPPAAPNAGAGGAGVASRPGVAVRTGQQIAFNLAVSRNPAGQFSLGNPPAISAPVPMGQATAGQMAQAVQNLISAATGKTFAPTATPPGTNSNSPASGNNPDASVNPPSSNTPAVGVNAPGARNTEPSANPTTSSPAAPGSNPPAPTSPGTTTRPTAPTSSGPGATPPPRVQPAPRTTPLSGER